MPITPEQFMELERTAAHRSEYLNGEVFAMAGASADHNRIVRNLIGILYNQLRGRACEYFGSDMMVLVEKTGLRAYPDLSGTCEPIQTLQQGIDVLLNPAFLVEVVSPSTEAYDRGKKFEHYKTIPSLREYLLVSSDRIHIDMYRRHEDGSWTIEVGLESVILQSVGATIALADVYEAVSL